MLAAPDLSLVYVMILFGIAVWVLNKLYFAPVLGILDERDREAREADELHARALEEARRAIEAAEERFGERRREAVSAREALRAEGRQVREQKLAAARAEAEKLIGAEKAQLAGMIPGLRDALSREAKSLADQVAKKVLAGVAK